MKSVRIQQSAPGKVILFGEHAVVYEQPAIAVPVTQVRAFATIEPAQPGNGLTIAAPDVGERIYLASALLDDPLAMAAQLVLDHLAVPEPDAVVTIHSTIPIASGLGSGAAVSTALARALAQFLDRPLGQAEISTLVFEVEKIHHGTPSGIDNTVVAYEQPIYFAKGHPIEQLIVGAPFTLLIGDTGIRSATKAVVKKVRQAWKQDAARYDALFDQIGDITEEARRAIESGDIYTLGSLMEDNHELLIEMDVSSKELDELVEAARFAGAIGAKLSGAGRGGNMITLIEDDMVEEVEEALKEAGARQVIRTRVE